MMRIVVVAAVLPAIGCAPAKAPTKHKRPVTAPARTERQDHPPGMTPALDGQETAMSARVGYIENKLAELQRENLMLQEQVSRLESRARSIEEAADRTDAAVRILAARTTQPSTPAPVPNTSTTRTAAHEDGRWWCFESGDSGWCEITKRDCEAMRVRIAGCEADRNEVAREACMSVRAGAHRVDVCRHQERAACFDRYFVVHDSTEPGCAPTMASCKARRGRALKNQRDDIKVKSDCKAVE